ncbi:RecB family exonuclease [Desulfogranum marinum]|uniref:RecB family exonuclease n=1 Tax=Desulfogranum marinum TaxID=453220 RepID=UPI001962FAD6|nr:PD-(D/E)XK nuclease family protein [Desulfogranum marinum]MBM9515238.1 PD-(D/E)XK nuclease family protein [Desulfogranum marinum]
MSQAIQSMRSQLHLSHSQLFTYLQCSLRFSFKYLLGLPVEHSSIALHFGKAIHAALEVFYQGIKETGKKPSLIKLEYTFINGLFQSMERTDAPVLYKKDMPDTSTAIAMGKKMLQVLHEESYLEGYHIEGVELPLSAPLYNHEGKEMDIQLMGIIDLLLRDNKGNLVAVDHKTAKQPKSQGSVDSDLQLTAYSYLLAANKYVFPRSEVMCRFDVLRKLKTPKLEIYNTTRGPDARKRFAKLSAAVLAGIENKVFLPCSSWMCADCEYSKACKKW